MEDIHREALRKFDKIQGAVKDERTLSLQDRRFYSIAGAQWEGVVGRQFENKPKFEFNKIHLSIMKIISEYRNSRISVNFLDKDDYEGSGGADFCNSLFRADEQDSVADEAYDNAFEESVGGGMGAWRLRTVYEDEFDDENELQRVKIEPIFDADTSVFFDLKSMRYDKSDADYCFVITAVPRDSYIEEWDDDPASWPRDVYQQDYDWCTPDYVYIAEYYVVEYQKYQEAYWRFLDNKDRAYDVKNELDADAIQALQNTGAKETGRKTKTRRRVHKYILSGGKILEDCGFIAGSCIPIVPVYGKRWVVDGLERFMGHVRLAKDAQRLKNMQVSKLAENSASSSIEKPIFMPEQVSGHEVMWAEDTIKNYPYLLLNPIFGPDGSVQPMGAIGYTKSPTVPPALVGLLQSTEQDIQDILGINPQSEKVASNISGKAIELIHERLDMQTYIYVSNLAKSMKRCGEIWLDMAKEIYKDPGRKMKGVDSKGDPSSIVLMEPDLEGGKQPTKNDFRYAKYDVVSHVGPSSASRKTATVRALTGVMGITQDPETLQVLGALVIMNLEGEGLSEVSGFFRKRLIRMGALEPTEQEAEKLQAEVEAEKDDEQKVLLKATAEQAMAKAEKAKAEVALTAAKTDEVKVSALEKLSKIEHPTSTLNIMPEVTDPTTGFAGDGNITMGADAMSIPIPDIASPNNLQPEMLPPQEETQLYGTRPTEPKLS